MEITSTIFQHVKDNNPIYRFSKHLFHPYLKAKSNKDKPSLFETFYEQIKVLNTNILDSYANQLQDLKHPIGDYQLLKDYLCYTKDNKELIIELLKRSIL